MLRVRKREGGTPSPTRLPTLSVLMSALFGVAAGLAVWFALQVARPTVPVVVALRDMQVGHVVRPDEVAVRKYPPVAVPPDAVRKPEEAVGKTVTGGAVLQGDVLRKKRLSAEGSLEASLKSLAPPGWVAVQLPEGSAQGMLGLRRGDRVDIYAETPTPGGAKQVLPVVRGAVLLLTPFQEGAKCYVVAVPPDSAQALAAIDVYGKKVSLVLGPATGGDRR
ncbi:Flp pilus assembly protein CpaB [Ammonifex degensii]|uniref:Flp pilus assembly protein CpaB n=1 Tax=Ammonifex degensii TaxID=42838 RepID=UPI0012EA970B|nr:SAF domain-containing protein [Ammonifex degensii]